MLKIFYNMTFRENGFFTPDEDVATCRFFKQGNLPSSINHRTN